MLLHTFIFSNKEVICVNVAKCMLKSAFFIGIGIGGTIAYIKYSKPVMQGIEKMIDKKIRKVDEELDEMM